jgi:hypothetical protein
VRLSIASPSGRTVETHAAIFVGYNGTPSAASAAQRLPIGTKLSQVGVTQAIKRGIGEPVLLLGTTAPIRRLSAQWQSRPLCLRA